MAAAAVGNPYVGVERAARAYFVAGGAWMGAVLAFAVLRREEPAVLALLAGSAASVVLGALWWMIPRALGRPLPHPLGAWATWIAWEAGAVACVAESAGLAPAAGPGMLGGFLLLLAALVLVDDVGRAVVRSAAWRRPGFLTAFPFLAVIALQLPLAALLLALSFQPGSAPELRGLSMGLLAGFTVPGGMLAWGLAWRVAN